MTGAAAFLPDARRGRRLDGEVRLGLAGSLSEVAGALAGIDVDTAALLRMAERARSGPCAPLVFALHGGLVEAILDEDAETLERLLVASAAGRVLAARTRLELLTLDDSDLGLPGACDLYRQFVVDDADAGIAVRPLPPPDLADAADTARAAVALIEDVDPQLSGELAALVRQVVLVRSVEGAARDFGGASSFHLWGAVFLNADRHRDRVAMAEGLVHEAAHLLLFGEAGGERIVENDDGDRHASPLRDDARPLDGIAHATFVLARMTYCAERLLASDRLTATERAAAEAALDRNRRDYRDGATVLERHARLTPAGDRMLGAAATYMSRWT